MNILFAPNTHYIKTIGNYTFDMRDYKGTGSQSSVFMGKKNVQKEQVVAIKILPLLSPTLQLSIHQSFISNERQILTIMKHPNILQLKQCLQTTNNMYFVTQLFTTDLSNYYKENVFTVEKVIKFLLVMSDVLCYLGNLQIIHRDIKPKNIFIRKLAMNKQQYVLGDFGFAFKQNNSPSCLSKINVGTQIYMSPQIRSLTQPNYSAKSDVWALGITALQLLNGGPTQDINQCFKNIICQNFTNNLKLVEILQKMLKPKVEERISPTQLLEQLQKLKDFRQKNPILDNPISPNRPRQYSSLSKNLLLNTSRKQRKPIFCQTNQRSISTTKKFIVEQSAQKIPIVFRPNQNQQKNQISTHQLNPKAPSSCLMNSNQLRIRFVNNYYMWPSPQQNLPNSIPPVQIQSKLVFNHQKFNPLMSLYQFCKKQEKGFFDNLGAEGRNLIKLLWHFANQSITPQNLVDITMSKSDSYLEFIMETIKCEKFLNISHYIGFLLTTTLKEYQLKIGNQTILQNNEFEIIEELKKTLAVWNNATYKVQPPSLKLLDSQQKINATNLTNQHSPRIEQDN